MSRQRDIEILLETLELERGAVQRYVEHGYATALAALADDLEFERNATKLYGRFAIFCPLCGWQIDFGAAPAEGTEGKCPMCPGKYALRLAGGDWALDRLAP
jgi:hypothetical protein